MFDHPTSVHDHSSNEPESVDVKQWNDIHLEESISVGKKLRNYRTATTVPSLLLAFVVPYTVFLAVFNTPRPPGTAPLGVDPSGFVPAYIGQPVKWVLDDESSPFFITPNAFNSIETTKATVRRMKERQGAYSVNINGNHANYVDDKGKEVPLSPTSISPEGEKYIIRAFHQMHCVTVLAEGFRYAHHNCTQKWSLDHIAHCLNVVRKAVTCLADATPISYIGDHEHADIGQQSRCRSYSTLWDWAHDPVRRANFEIVSAEESPDQYKELARQYSTN